MSDVESYIADDEFDRPALFSQNSIRTVYLGLI